MRRIDLTNKRVGMLTAKEPSHTNAHGIEARIKAGKDYFKEYAPYQEGEVKED